MSRIQAAPPPGRPPTRAYQWTSWPGWADRPNPKGHTTMTTPTTAGTGPTGARTDLAPVCEMRDWVLSLVAGAHMGADSALIVAQATHRVGTCALIHAETARALVVAGLLEVYQYPDSRQDHLRLTQRGWMAHLAIMQRHSPGEMALLVDAVFDLVDGVNPQ